MVTGRARTFPPRPRRRAPGKEAETTRSRTVQIAGPAGRIEGILQGRAEEARRLAVVCHPHPLGGGTMHTKVVHRTARALLGAGHLVLRFNFRGVGGSAGRHDRGEGERDDLRAALAWLRARRPGLPATIAGFSFGSWVGMAVGCADSEVDALVGIGIPANLYDFGFLASCGKPKLLVHGTADTLAPLRDLEAILPSVAEPRRLVRIDGGSHLLTEGLDEVEEAVRRFAERLPPDRS